MLPPNKPMQPASAAAALAADGHRRWADQHPCAMRRFLKPSSCDPSFRLTVQDKFVIEGRGLVVMGQVESGVLRVGEAVLVQHLAGTASSFTVWGIEAFRKTLEVATAGDDVGVILSTFKRDDVQAGDVLCGKAIG